MDIKKVAVIQPAPALYLPSETPDSQQKPTFSRGSGNSWVNENDGVRLRRRLVQSNIAPAVQFSRFQSPQAAELPKPKITAATPEERAMIAELRKSGDQIMRVMQLGRRNDVRFFSPDQFKMCSVIASKSGAVKIHRHDRENIIRFIPDINGEVHVLYTDASGRKIRGGSLRGERLIYAANLAKAACDAVLEDCGRKF